MDSGPAPSGASRNDGGCSSMIIPRHADGAGDVAVARCQFETGAGGLLADGVAVELLPRRLVFRIRKSAHGLEVGEALLELLGRDQDIRVPLIEVDADTIAGLEHGKSAVGGRFR